MNGEVNHFDSGDKFHLTRDEDSDSDTNKGIYIINVFIILKKTVPKVTFYFCRYCNSV